MCGHAPVGGTLGQHSPALGIEPATSDISCATTASHTNEKRDSLRVRLACIQRQPRLAASVHEDSVEQRQGVYLQESTEDGRRGGSPLLISITLYLYWYHPGIGDGDPFVLCQEPQGYHG